MKIYTVLMYRFGDRERHSYLLGVYQKKHAAIKAAEEEKAYRGGNKYYPLVEEWTLDEKESNKTIVPLPDQFPFIEAKLLKAAQRQHKERKA